MKADIFKIETGDKVVEFHFVNLEKPPPTNGGCALIKKGKAVGLYYDSKTFEEYKPLAAQFGFKITRIKFAEFKEVWENSIDSLTRLF